MVSCAALNCSNRHIGKNVPNGTPNDVSFHTFPKDPVRRAEWVAAVRRENWIPSRSSKLCSNHFREEDMDRTSLCYVRLRENVVPSIFQFHVYPNQEPPKGQIRKVKQSPSHLKRKEFLAQPSPSSRKFTLTLISSIRPLQPSPSSTQLPEPPSPPLQYLPSPSAQNSPTPSPQASPQPSPPPSQPSSPTSPLAQLSSPSLAQTSPPHSPQTSLPPSPQPSPPPSPLAQMSPPHSPNASVPTSPLGKTSTQWPGSPQGSTSWVDEIRTQRLVENLKYLKRKLVKSNRRNHILYKENEQLKKQITVLSAMVTKLENN